MDVATGEAGVVRGAPGVNPETPGFGIASSNNHYVLIIIMRNASRKRYHKPMNDSFQFVLII